MTEAPAHRPSSDGDALDGGGSSDPGHGRRQQILRAAFEVLAERGHAGATLGAIAERVGVTRPALLHHFGSREQLLLDALVLWEKTNVERLREQLGAEEDLELRLRRLLDMHVEQPQLVRAYLVMATASLSPHHATQHYFVQRYRHARAQMMPEVVRLLGADAPGGPLPQHVATLLLAVLDGVQLQWLLDPDQVDLQGTASAFWQLLRSSSAS